jgi:mRNA-degrading endonuclease RelE of RelBE toxin-antitoxin system
MQVDIHSSFVRDSKKLTPAIKESIADAIMLMEKAVKFSEIPGIKALQGGKKAKNAYRMRVADHRYCREKKFIRYFPELFQTQLMF